MGCIAAQTQPGHSGIRLEVDLHLSTLGLGRRREGLGALQIPDGLSQTQTHHISRELRRSLPQDQDGGRDPRYPELCALIQRGDRQVVRAQLFQTPGHRDGTVAVCVGLDYPQKAAARGQHPPQRPVIMLQSAQVDLGPGALLPALHVTCLLSRSP